MLSGGRQMLFWPFIKFHTHDTITSPIQIYKLYITYPTNLRIMEVSMEDLGGVQLSINCFLIFDTRKMTRKEEKYYVIPQTLFTYTSSIYCLYCSVGKLLATALYFIYPCCTVHTQTSPLGCSLNTSLSSTPQSQALCNSCDLFFSSIIYV